MKRIFDFSSLELVFLGKRAPRIGSGKSTKSMKTIEKQGKMGQNHRFLMEKTRFSQDALGSKWRLKNIKNHF